MAVCDITSGIAKELCKASLGGAKKIYFFNNLEDPFTVADSVATAINPLLTVAYEFEIIGDGNKLLQNVVSDRTTYTTVNTQTLTLKLGKINATKNATLNLLLAGFPMAVVQDRNNNYHIVGIDEGIDFTIDSDTGGVKTEFNGYTLTGVSTTGSLAPIMDSATETAFKALVV